MIVRRHAESVQDALVYRTGFIVLPREIPQMTTEHCLLCLGVYSKGRQIENIIQIMHSMSQGLGTVSYQKYFGEWPQ